MKIRDIEDFRLSDAIEFHDELNPLLFTDEHMQSDVREQLMVIAHDFVEFMGIQVPKVVDVRLYGSNAAYTWTKHSDIDLHILVDMSHISDNEVYLELFNAKKNLFNDSYTITVRGLPVELYMQDSNDKVQSLGDYSILHDKWVSFPKRAKATIEEANAIEKFKRIAVLAELALRSSDLNKVNELIDTIRRYRRAGLAAGGEFSVENLVFKALRNKNIIEKLYDHRDALKSEELSIDEDDEQQLDIVPQDSRETALMDEFKQFMEASGYIPSESEKNDPRFSRALSVDVHPQTMKRQAKAMGLGNIERTGRPQKMNPSGKFIR